MRPDRGKFSLTRVPIGEIIPPHIERPSPLIREEMEVAKQSHPITKDCQHRSVCLRPATIGVYRWIKGQTDVNLDKPVAVFCGQHKPALDRNQLLRNVRVAR